MGGSLSVYVYKKGYKIGAETAYKSTSLMFDSTRIDAMKTFLESFNGPLTSVTIRSEGGYVPDNIIKGCVAIESLLKEKLESQQGVPVLFEIVCDTKLSEYAVIDIVEYILEKNNKFDATIKFGDSEFRRAAGENRYLELKRDYSHLMQPRGMYIPK
jgi:hypothetical protein